MRQLIISPGSHPSLVLVLRSDPIQSSAHQTVSFTSCLWWPPPPPPLSSSSPSPSPIPLPAIIFVVVDCIGNGDRRESRAMQHASRERYKIIKRCIVANACCNSQPVQHAYIIYTHTSAAEATTAARNRKQRSSAATLFLLAMPCAVCCAADRISVSDTHAARRRRRDEIMERDGGGVEIEMDRTHAPRYIGDPMANNRWIQLRDISTG